MAQASTDEAAYLTVGFTDTTHTNSTDTEFTSHKIVEVSDELYPNLWALNLTKISVGGQELDIPMDGYSYTTSFPCAECPDLMLGNTFMPMVNEYLPDDWQKGILCPQDTEQLDMSLAFQIDDMIYTIPFEAYTVKEASEIPYTEQCTFMVSESPNVSSVMSNVNVVLGYPFLRSFSAVFDYDTNTVGFAVSVNAPAGTKITKLSDVDPSGGGDDDGKGGDDDDMSVWLIVILIVGGILLVAVIGIVVFCCIKGARERADKETANAVAYGDDSNVGLDSSLNR